MFFCLHDKHTEHTHRKAIKAQFCCKLRQQGPDLSKWQSTCIMYIRISCESTMGCAGVRCRLAMSACHSTTNHKYNNGLVCLLVPIPLLFATCILVVSRTCTRGFAEHVQLSRYVTRRYLDLHYFLSKFQISIEKVC